MSELLMQKIVFELCAESIDACMVARASGAHRIELCSALSEGGVTPSYGLIREAVSRSGLPVHILLRPRGGDFIYTDAELEVMREDLTSFRELGVSGIVIGFLHTDGTVNQELTREFVTMAGPLEVSFNRAFDHTPSLEQALEAVIACGCNRVLTSAGQRDVLQGAEALARLVRQAAGRIDVAIGGGLRLTNAAEVARKTGAQHFHGSLRRPVASPMRYQRPSVLEEEGILPETRFAVSRSDIQCMIETLSNAFTVNQASTPEEDVERS
jgi:copper homeostasis protein